MQKTIPLIALLTILSAVSAQENPLPSLVAEGVQIEAPFSGKEEDLQRLCEEIAGQYREQEGKRVFVSPLSHDLVLGTAHLSILPEKLGEIRVKEEQHTAPETIARWVSTPPQGAIDENLFAKDVAWLNESPYRKVKLEYQKTEKPGITDVDLLVADEKNWKMEAGVDNTGNQLIGPLRMYTSFDVNNFLFADHTLHLKAKVADAYKEYQSYHAKYTIPLPWRNTLVLSGTYSQTTPHSSPFPQRHRLSYEATGRYLIPYWFDKGSLLDQIKVELGADFKGSNTDLFDQGNPLPTSSLLSYIGQFVTGCSVEKKVGGAALKGALHLIGSPGRMLPHQSDVDFANLRKGATPTYGYSKLSFSWDQNLPFEWKLGFKVKGQLSASLLMPSEQVALGGESTVRGYLERIVNGDHGVWSNLELKTPTFPLIGLFTPQVKDKLGFLAFVDGGSAWFKNDPLQVAKDQSLLGVGTGLRYTLSSYLKGGVDVGYPLLAVAKDPGNPRVHFSTTVRY